MTSLKKAILKQLANFEKRFFDSKIELIYTNHIPFVAFYITKGHLEMTKKNKVIKSISAGEFVGLENLLNGTPINFSIVATPESEVYIIDRSTLTEIQN